MNVLVIVGYPDEGSFSHALAHHFYEKAKSLGQREKWLKNVEAFAEKL